MATKEITTKLRNEIAVDIQAIPTDTTTVGNIIPVADFDHGVNFTFVSGVVTDGDYDVLIEHGDDPALADAAAVPDTQLVGQDPTSAVAPELQAQISASDEIKKIGYVGPKAFVRKSIVSTSTSTGGTMGSIVEKRPEIEPAEIVS